MPRGPTVYSSRSLAAHFNWNQGGNNEHRQEDLRLLALHRPHLRLRLLQLRGVSSRIVLVRHGRSAHRPRGWMDAEGLRGWLRAYDAAGLARDERAPAALREVTAAATAILSSDLSRARASAALLAGNTSVIESPLLRELELWMPQGSAVRLPLPAWALVIGAARAMHEMRTTQADARHRARAAAAATLIGGLAAERSGTVVAVTHASFRRLLCRALLGSGWQLHARSGWSRPWSAWTLKRSASSRS